LKPAQANSFQDPILKIPNTKQDWWSGSNGIMFFKKSWGTEGMSEMVECQLWKCKVLNSNLSTAKRRGKRRKKRRRRIFPWTRSDRVLA
jgi:hypothetical protein